MKTSKQKVKRKKVVKKSFKQHGHKNKTIKAFETWGLKKLNFNMKTGEKLTKPHYMTPDGKGVYPATNKGWTSFVNDLNSMKVMGPK